ncbi:MAG: glycoside hydrolase family 3 N-terminal domain-containing protein [Desulfobacterales bacterium]
MAIYRASELPAEDLAGQRVVVGFDGQRFNDDLRDLIGGLRVGGIILFSRNIDHPEQVAALCSEAQAYAESQGLPPLFIAVDQEGGVVARLKAPHFTEFPGAPFLRDPDDARHFARVTARELRSVGFNMDMAPVMDVAPAERESVMTRRVFGTAPEQVAKIGRTVIESLQAAGVMAVAKHFPGIGRTTLDSHIDRPFMDAPAEAIDAFELPPFEAAISADVAGIMLSHIVYERLDPRWPASLSPAIARELLRNRMRYKGVVMTDDLDMGAIARHYDIRTVVRQILDADIDLALICHKGPNPAIAVETIRDRIREDGAMQERAVASVRRILSLKNRYIA